jgi:hypothetical protein
MRDFADALPSGEIITAPIISVGPDTSVRICRRRVKREHYREAVMVSQREGGRLVLLGCRSDRGWESSA